jgi:hypothetical protein
VTDHFRCFDEHVEVGTQKKKEQGRATVTPFPGNRSMVLAIIAPRATNLQEQFFSPGGVRFSRRQSLLALPESLKFIASGPSAKSNVFHTRTPAKVLVCPFMEARALQLDVLFQSHSKSIAISSSVAAIGRGVQ